MANDKEKAEVIKRIKEEIARLDKASAKAYQDTLKSLDDTVANLDVYQKLLNNIKNDVASIDKGFSGILQEIVSINQELQKGDKNTKDVTKAFRGLESIAQKLKYDQQGFNELNLDQLKKEQSKLKILEDQARSAALKLAKDKGINDLANTNLSLLQNISEEELAILTAAQLGFTVYEETNELLKERIEKEEEINKKLGITGVLLKGISKIPIVGPLLKVNDALDAARKKAQDNGNAFQVMGAGLSSMGKSLLSSLKDPLVVIGLLVKGFQALLKLGFMVDKQETQLAKSFALSESSAHGLRNTLNDIQDSSAKNLHYQERSLVNTTALVEASTQLGDALGASVIPTQEQLENQIMLTKQIGLSVEEANNLQKLAFDNRMSADDITKEVIKQTKSYRNQTGVQLDNKKILQDVSKISGQLRLQYGNNVKQLTAAVVQSQKLGLSLEQTKKIAEGLLNFEESIANELSAEL